MKKERIKDLLNLEEDSLRLDEAPNSKGIPKLGQVIKNAAKNKERDIKAAIKQKQADNPAPKSQSTNPNKKDDKTKGKGKEVKTEEPIPVDADVLGTKEETSDTKEITAQKVLSAAWNSAEDKTQQDNLIKAIQTILTVMSEYSAETEAKGEPSNEQTI